MKRVIQATIAALLWSLWATSATAQQLPKQQTSVTAQQLPAVRSRERANAPRLQGFNVVLVLGDLEAGPATPDNVPVAARKALADMKDFLPYKSYRLLDSTWILSASGSANATVRLRGLEDRDYELALSAAPEPESFSARTLRMSFQLRNPGGPSPTPSIDRMRSEVESRNRALAEGVARRGDQLSGPPAADEASRKIAEAAEAARRAEVTRRIADARELERALNKLAEQTGGRAIAQNPQRIIDTGFTMEIGETVVVGTSRVRGDKAIIALLTAVPRAK